MGLDWLLDGLGQALRLLATGDADTYGNAWVSLEVSLAATLIACLLGLPLGYWLGAYRFPGRRALRMAVDTLLSLPTVVVGLLAYALLSRQGLLGPLGLLYTRTAIVLGEVMLVLPLATALAAQLVEQADPRLLPTLRTLGASGWQAAASTLGELHRAALALVVTVFGRLLGELGVALMLGGNIRRETRTLTTAIALETGKGEFAQGLALGIVLLGLALLVNVALHALAGPRGAR